MAISVDPLTDEIYVPKADLTLIQASPEVRELDVNAFRLWLLDWEDGEDAIPRPKTHTHNTEVTLAGLTYARIVEVLSPYTVEFEDGQYTVNCVGANHNISDKKVANQVSLIVNNAAGLITNAAIEYSSFNGGVTIDTANASGKAVSGTLFPIGTPQSPVDNIDDAFTIAEFRGFPTFFVVGDLHLTAAVPDLSNYAFIGGGMDRSIITIDPNATVNDCEYRDATVTGTLDGNNRLVDCMIEDLTYVKGIIERCVLSAAVITLDGAEEAHFLDCWSGVPGLSTPTIDLGGSGQALALRNYNGGIKLQNKTGPEDVSIDLNSGQIIIDSTVTNGDIVCRGIGKLTDNSVGANVLADDLLSKDIISQAVWTATADEVFIDLSSGNSGTKYPIGTASAPVDNLADAKLIAAETGARTFVIRGTVILDGPYDKWGFRGWTAAGNDVVVNPGAAITSCKFERCTVAGTFGAGSADNEMILCYASNPVAYVGTMVDTGIVGTLTLGGEGSVLIMINSSMADYPATIDFVGANRVLKANFEVADVVVTNMGAGSFLQLSMDSGTAVIDASCTGGTVVTTGIVKVTNNATGVVHIDNSVSIDSIANGVWSYER